MDRDSINWFIARISNRCQQCDTERVFGSLFKHSDSSRQFRLRQIRNWPAKCIDGVRGLRSLPCRLPEIMQDGVQGEHAASAGQSYRWVPHSPQLSICCQLVLGCSEREDSLQLYFRGAEHFLSLSFCWWCLYCDDCHRRNTTRRGSC